MATDEEIRAWYEPYAKQFGVNPDPFDPRHYYDFRAAYAAGVTPNAQGHWPSQFKLPGHPNRYVGGIDTITGQPVNKELPMTYDMNNMNDWMQGLMNVYRPGPGTGFGVGLTPGPYRIPMPTPQSGPPPPQAEVKSAGVKSEVEFGPPYGVPGAQEKKIPQRSQRTAVDPELARFLRRQPFRPFGNFARDFGIAIRGYGVPIGSDIPRPINEMTGMEDYTR